MFTLIVKLYFSQCVYSTGTIGASEPLQSDPAHDDRMSPDGSVVGWLPTSNVHCATYHCSLLPSLPFSVSALTFKEAPTTALAFLTGPTKRCNCRRI